MDPRYILDALRAADISITLGTYYNWERGFTSVPAVALPQLCKVLNASEDDLLAMPIKVLGTYEKRTRHG